MDPEIFREIRIELARRDIKVADLIEDMWYAYVEAGRPEREHAPIRQGMGNHKSTAEV